MVLEKTLESPLDFKEIQPDHPKVDQSWVFIGRTDVEAETPILWPPDAKSWLIWKDPDAGKDWRQEEKGMTEDEIVGWHHWLNGHGFGWNPGVGDGQGGLVCCGSWGCKKSDTTEWLNWTMGPWVLSWTEINILSALYNNNWIDDLQWVFVRLGKFQWLRQCMLMWSVYYKISPQWIDFELPGTQTLHPHL